VRSSARGRSGAAGARDGPSARGQSRSTETLRHREDSIVRERDPSRANEPIGETRKYLDVPRHRFRGMRIPRARLGGSTHATSRKRVDDVVCVNENRPRGIRRFGEKQRKRETVRAPPDMTRQAWRATSQFHRIASLIGFSETFSTLRVFALSGRFLGWGRRRRHTAITRSPTCLHLLDERLVHQRLRVRITHRRD